MMRIFAFFLACSLISHVRADIRVVYYNHPLALTYLKHGDTHFLQSCRDLPSQEYKDALQDLINLATRNSIKVPALLRGLETTLRSKIHRIERLEGKAVDWKEVLDGSSIVGISCVASGGLYGIYKKYYQPYYHDEDSTRHWEGFFSCSGCVIAMLGYFGCMILWGGLFPYREDRYRDQYTIFLQITQEFIQKHCPSNNTEEKTA